VTIVFSDLKGSTALTEKIDAEAINEVKERYFSAMAAEIYKHGGKIEKYIGDAIMAVFGLPRAREDDALRAVRAAHGMTVAMERLNEDLDQFYGVTIAARTGVNTGEVVANDNPDADQRLATGDAVNVAARLEQAAPANEVLIGEVTYALVRAHVQVEPVEPLELKGKAERVPAYRLVSIRSTPVDSAALASDAPLVGRDAQLQELRTSLNEVVSRGGCRIATVAGEAGVGKSHLVDTFVVEVSPTVTVLRGRCLSYGDGITFWPLVEVARSAAGIVEDDSPESALAKLAAPLEGMPDATEIRDRIASVIGLSSTSYPVGEIFWGARKYLESLASRRPVVLVIEDIHNAEPTFLDLLDHLRETTLRQAAVLAIGTARLELLEKRPEWGTQPGNARVSMPPLGNDDTARLIEVVLAGPVADAVKARIIGSAEGNPLFVSQLVSMLVDKGLVRRDEDRWVATGDLESIAVPPTVQALLAARLDDLSREERAVLEPASVIGLAFPQPAIAELVPATIKSDVGTHLGALDRKQFVDRDQGKVGEDEIYRFRNLLIRDATYGSLLKRARAQMHERFVAWAERVNKERGREEEFEEILGYHLEQAYRYRTELGPIDADGRALAERAAAKLGSSGLRALGRGDLPATINLLRRAVTLLQPNDPVRLELLLEVAEALLEAGEGEEAWQRMAEAEQAATELADPRLTARVRVARLNLEVYGSDDPPAPAEAIASTTEAVRVFEELGDEGGLTRAALLQFVIHATAGHLEEAAAAAERAANHAQAAGDMRLLGGAATSYASVALRGPRPAEEVAQRCSELLALFPGTNRRTEAVVLGVLAQLRAMRGSIEEARMMSRRGRQLLADLGRSVAASSTSTESARIEILAGDLPAAEALLRDDDVALEGLGERYYRSTVVAMLANVIAQQGRDEEAARLADLAAELGSEDDIATMYLVQTARARVAAIRGELTKAVDLASSATERLPPGIDLADAISLLGELQLGAGAHAAARASLSKARELYAGKGELASIDRVDSLLAGLITA
jgi:class 3 adenylate cyclase/tetratricopeptide (TPR) repeat protein